MEVAAPRCSLSVTYLFIYPRLSDCTRGSWLWGAAEHTEGKNKDLQWLSHYSEGLFSKFSFFPNLRKKKSITFSTRKQRQADIRVWGQQVYRMRRCFKKGLGDEGEHYLSGHLFQATTKLYYFLLSLTIQKSLGLDSRHANRRYLHTGWCAGWFYINLTRARVI